MDTFEPLVEILSILEYSIEYLLPCAGGTSLPPSHPSILAPPSCSLRHVPPSCIPNIRVYSLWPGCPAAGCLPSTTMGGRTYFKIQATVATFGSVCAQHGLVPVGCGPATGYDDSGERFYSFGICGAACIGDNNHANNRFMAWSGNPGGYCDTSARVCAAGICTEAAEFGPSSPAALICTGVSPASQRF